MKHVKTAVEKNRDLILSAERYIWKNPETGYKEYKTSAYMARQFRALGYELTHDDMGESDEVFSARASAY